ncbi:MAG: anti-sigma F factor [Clostridia bacterium]|nr:anti-sigma F factor [Clostridia bacterium]
MCNEMKLDFPSHSRNESFARAAAGAFIASLDPTASELSDIKCALSEAVTNCTVHAYPDCIGMIRLEIKLREDRTVIITVKDKGVGIPNIEQAREPLFTTDAAGERSGMGFTVMEGFSDNVKITSKPGRGTSVTMTRKLKGKFSS